MKKGIVKCEFCNVEIQGSCELANYTRVIDGITHTFCCRICANQYKPGKAKAE